MQRYWLRFISDNSRITEAQHLFGCETVERSEDPHIIGWGEYAFSEEDILNDLADYCLANGLNFVYGQIINRTTYPAIFDSRISKFVHQKTERVVSPSLKYYNISNEKYEKQVEKCAYCGATTITIVKKGAQKLTHKFIPNDPQRRLVCKSCMNTTQMSVGGYGFDRRPSRFMTPMDSKNTVILGLEQEFEGYFFGWLELQRAHKGMLKYGYDSSIALKKKESYHSNDPNNGKNELSWDCGSYSWWKYASPLKEVCDVVRKHGGEEGSSAGVHIHASFTQMTTEQTKFLARRCFELLQSREDVKNLMLIVSGRSRERLDRWAYMDDVHPESSEAGKNGGVRKAVYTDHHSCISYNGVGTIEFRCFSACLDHKRVLKRMKFVKEYVTLVKNKVHPDDFIKSFSAGVKMFIKQEQQLQLEAGNVTKEQFVLK